MNPSRGECTSNTYTIYICLYIYMTFLLLAPPSDEADGESPRHCAGSALRRHHLKQAPSSSLPISSLELIDAKVYEPSTRALLGTAVHFCEVVVLKLRTNPAPSTRPGCRIQRPWKTGSWGQPSVAPWSDWSIPNPKSIHSSSSSLLLSSLELIDAKVYEP